MKKLSIVAVAIIVILTSFCLFACSDPNVNSGENVFAFKVDSADYSITAETTVKDYMDLLSADGKVDYKVVGGMVSEINGKSNTLDFGSCWMLYTDDAEMANSDWGTYDYDGKTLGSAILGAESLKIKDGCLYVWAYITF